ncbi:hypothetical protein [Treponema vincentii]|uniref:Uncharacterized protein n=1 Tax=Treponema medium ATCC 700293 TaxID=1125700 RepID=A0AA87TFH7_TREMD|nr:hypothetical protein [Treponema vincentii]EPF27661.1 hypothetical protein HMPREF9195_02159 [Treponema medium ATCC 700293]
MMRKDKNAGEDIDLEQDLIEMQKRGKSQADITAPRFHINEV